MFSCRRPGFNFHQPQPSITLILENSTTLFWPSWASDTHMVHSHIAKQNIYTHKINKSQIKKKASLLSYIVILYIRLHSTDETELLSSGLERMKPKFCIDSCSPPTKDLLRKSKLYNYGKKASSCPHECIQALPSIIFLAEALLLHLLTLTFSIIMPSL